MANVFISYKSEDHDTAVKLASLLKKKKHTISFDLDLFIGSSWREQMLEALLASDAVVVLWSEKTNESQFVPAEVGAARAAPQISVLPVVIGDIAIPRFINDLVVKRILDTDDATLEDLGNEIHESIIRHIEISNFRKRGKPKVFISHRHKDEPLVRALTDCIKTYFEIAPKDIRCTSVRPYRLPVGENTGDRLRGEITDAEVVFGILTTDTLESTYVAFELGSAWGQGVWTCPLLASGADQSHIPDLIRDRSPLFLNKTGDCFQLFGDMEGFTTLKKREDFNLGEFTDKINRLVEEASRK